MARWRRNRGETGQSADRLHPDAVPVAAEWRAGPSTAKESLTAGPRRVMDSGMASDLGHNVHEYQGDPVLSTEFLSTSTELMRVILRLERLVIQQNTAQQTELEACRSRR